jgi:type IV secretion system protein VirB4
MKHEDLEQLTRASSAEDELSRIIPFSSQVADGVVTTRSGDFAATWHVAGIPFEGLNGPDAAAALNALNLLVRGLSTGKFAFWVHRVRRKVSDQLTLPPSGFARDLMAQYYATMTTGSLVATEIYLTVLYRPNPQGRFQLFGRSARQEDDVHEEFLSAIETLENLDRQIRASLQRYGPRRLRNYQLGTGTFSEQLEFYSFLVNGHWWRIPAKDIPAHRYIGVARVLFGNEIVETRDTYGRTYSAFVDIKDYSDFTEAGCLNALIALDCEYVETHSFSPFSKPDAKTALERQRGQLIGSADSAQSQIAQMTDALDALISDNFSFGEYHYSLQVKASTPDGVREARSKAIERLQAAQYLGVAVDLVVAHAFAAQLPGNWTSRPRIAKISSRNFCGLCSLHNFGSGKRDGNPWGEAVMILKSPANQPVYFNFHSSEPGVDSFGKPDLGNTQVIGKSRSGKTVLVLLLIANMLKYGTQVVYFDKDRGAEIAIRAMDGRYFVMQRGKPTGLAPFKMEPTEANRLFWIDLIKHCSRLDYQPHTPQEEHEIAQAVKALARMPVQLRSFEALIQNLPSTDANSVAARLRKWATGGSYAWALDSPEDTLDFDAAQLCGLDYTEILDDKTACPALMMYLMYRVDQRIDGRRFAFAMDEYWKAIENEFFEAFAKNKQKTIGKQNGLGIFMTQSTSDTLASPIARALIEQTATFILLPNPAADRDEYVNGFKVSETVFDLVRSLPEGSRMFVIVQGDRVSVAKLDLQGFDDELTILSGTTANVDRLDKLRARLGDKPEVWMQPFLRDTQ